MVRDTRLLAMRRWAGSIAAIVLLAAVALLGAPPVSWPAVAAATFDRDLLERGAAAATARWQREGDEPDDEPANSDAAGPADAYDGLYGGTVQTLAAIHVVTFRLKVANGIGSGTQSRLDCGVAPVSLRISPAGKISGMVLVFGATCLKTELAIRGQAVGGMLLLRIGNQYLELAKLD